MMGIAIHAMTKINRIDPEGRSAQALLEDVLASNPDQVMVVWTKADQAWVAGSNGKDRFWRMGALAAAMVEEWTFDI